jgi:hypothetical protein
MTVRGTMIKVKPIEVLQDKVYIRKNIVKIDEDGEEGFHGWEYEETDLSVEQYLYAIEVMGHQITNLLLEV